MYFPPKGQVENQTISLCQLCNHPKLKPSMGVVTSPCNKGKQYCNVEGKGSVSETWFLRIHPGAKAVVVLSGLLANFELQRFIYLFI